MRAAMPSAWAATYSASMPALLAAVLARVPGAAAQQRDRASGVAPAGVGQADGDLREAPPELALRCRG